MTELPPPGWYDDPTDPGRERWWDGSAWSEQTRVKAPEAPTHTPGDLRRVGDYLNHAFGILRARWDDLLLVSAIGAILIAFASTVFFRPVLDSIDVVNDRIVGWGSAETSRLVLTIVASGLVFLITSATLAKISWEAATSGSGRWTAALQFGIAITPRYIGWVLLAVLPVIGLIVLVVLVLRASEGLGVMLFLAFVGAAIWWTLVISFLPIALVAQPRGNPIIKSLAIVRRRWWRIFGRLLVMQLLVLLVTQILGAVLDQLLDLNLFGFDFVEIGSGDIQLVKDSRPPLDYFLAASVSTVLSLVATAGQLAAIASMAGDVTVLERE